ncbi:MAG: hypothetical protein AAF968_06340 [Pseudomonadota bacterium]
MQRLGMYGWLLFLLCLFGLDTAWALSDDQIVCMSLGEAYAQAEAVEEANGVESMLNEAVNIMLWCEEHSTWVAWIGVMLTVILVGLIATVMILLWRKRTITAACVYVLLICYCFVPLSAVVGFAAVFLSKLGEATQFNQYLSHASLLLIAGFLGAVGGAINCTQVLMLPGPSEAEDFRFRSIGFRPLNGLFLAMVMYTGIQSGTMIAFSTESVLVPKVWTVAFLAVLTGIFSDMALRKLRAVTVNLLGDGGPSSAPAQGGAS